MSSQFLSSLFATILLLSSPSCLLAQDWPAFLGPDGTAKAPDANVVTEWSESKNLAWKVDLPGPGSSSPIVVGDKVIVVCSIGKEPESRKVLCFNKNDGGELWSVDYPIDYREDGFRGYLMEHGYASNTPVSDGENVYVFLGKGGVHSISLDGKKGWSFDVGKGSSNRRWGSAASLALHNDNVIVNAAEEAKSIIAVNKKTGKEVWRQDASMLELAYGTPRVVSAGEEDELVIAVPTEVWALRPDTGKLKWFAESPTSGNVSPSVIVDGETVYSFGGYQSKGSIAIKAGGKKDVTKANVLWTSRISSYVATPLLHEGKLYWIDDKGTASCTLAKDGTEVYRERVDGLSGRPVYASPLLIGDYIYVVTRRGGTIVYSPGDKFEPIARNKFDGDKTDFNATPAVSDGKLFLRSNQALYCVGK